ncbi:prepilin-type N-terminal cleavage/methylation domain-containing protein [Psychrobacter sp. PP-21]|uniref:prepilin-type N-terminal cleavage/methylation domain-containing protein n=1 Tax=Psychrobacter sp. PP-21 TaxID=2957503 RepID=UPI0029B7EAFC|nr:prepilin-type N-terminal cleavage/methylation domain-containing protein [Psychrobacter sp. PP-21]MDX2372836.1 prepilin-type N-terminal cleavage/methylation domain-containing protein [Psychrobacter sp. PP-21]
MPVTVKTQSSSVATRPLALISQTSRSLRLPHFGTITTNPHYSGASSTVCDSLSPLSIYKTTQTGFTLVEIVVVVVILSIFAGMMSLSVGSSESRKNRAFYEHLTDSLSYVRLLSAERMQPMGLRLQADNQGQIEPVIVTLSNPYIAYQTADSVSGNLSGNFDSQSKNSMELSADLGGMSGFTGEQQPTPSWDLESEVSLPELPAGVSIRVQSLDAINLASTGQTQSLQPWFSDQTVPQLLWFGTGQATPVTIEVIHDSRLVGEVITIMPDGSMMIGQGL